jgi:thioredoxin 1
MAKPLWTLLPESFKAWLLTLWVRLKSWWMPKADRELETKSDDVIATSVLTEIEKAPLAIVDFGAEWCGPCRRISPIFHTLATEFKDKATFFSFDIDTNQELAVELGVGSIPAFHIYKSGKLVNKMIGADPDKLRKLVEAVCN